MWLFGCQVDELQIHKFLNCASVGNLDAMRDMVRCLRFNDSFLLFKGSGVGNGAISV